MELVSILVLNSLFPALLLSILVLVVTRLNLLLRILLAIVVLIAADVTISIATLFAFEKVGLLPSKHTMEYIQRYLVGEYLARSVMFWVVGIFLIVKSSVEKSKQFAFGVALMIFAWELIFFLIEAPVSSLFVGNPFWRFVSVGFYCALALFVQRKTWPSRAQPSLS
jgi:hypothetical protein